MEAWCPDELEQPSLDSPPPSPPPPPPHPHLGFSQKSTNFSNEVPQGHPSPPYPQTHEFVMLFLCFAEETFADSYPGCTEGGILTREDGGMHFEAFFIEEKLLPQAAKDIAESILPAGWTQKEDTKEAANICP